MRRLILVLGGLLAFGGHAAESEYAVYKASAVQVYDYHFVGGAWEAQPDKYASFLVTEVSTAKGLTLHRVLMVDYWTGSSGRYYDSWVSTGWFRLLELDPATVALVSVDLDTKHAAVADAEAMVLTGKRTDGLPKGFAGIHLTVEIGGEVEREEVKARLDKKLSAAAQAAAATAVGDPFVPIRDILVGYLQSRGYVQAR